MKPKIRVIIAEDDPQIAEINRRLLERIDACELVGLAHNLDQTYDLIEVMQPDLVLLDIQFPQGSGLDLLRSLRSQSNGTDVILITGAREVETIKEALHGGVFDYIIKPLVFERLESAIHNYMEHREKLDQLDSIQQADVDALLPRDRFAGTPHEENKKKAKAEKDRRPKGIDELTLQNVTALFTDDSLQLSAEEVGKKLGASRITARRYLEYLISENFLVAHIQYGTVGRPERRYSRKS